MLNTEGGPNHLNNMCDAPIIVDKENDSYIVQPIYYHIGHFSKFIHPGAVRLLTSVSEELSCSLKQSADDYQAICASILYACNNGLICQEGYFQCYNYVGDNGGRAYIRSCANDVYNRWYRMRVQDVEAAAATKTSYSLEDVGEGPLQACDFGGLANLRGVQVTSWANPDNTTAVVVLNIGDEAVDYVLKLSLSQQAANLTIPPHSIATLVF